MDYQVTFDDILLVPQYSDIRSRNEVDLFTHITPLRTLNRPILSANMDTVTEFAMAKAMADFGGCGVLHRFISKEEQANWVATLRGRLYSPVVAAIGVREEAMERAELLIKAGCEILVIDVAHGDSIQVVELIKAIKDRHYIEIIAGNVATRSGARTLFEAGADGIKVGIGGSGICSTRLVTGHGVPQFDAIRAAIDVRREYPKRTVIADGGIRQSGDIVKALAAGADCVMLGSLLAGTDETPGKIHEEDGLRYKTYRGMASAESNEAYFGKSSFAPEGISIRVPYKGPVADILRHLTAGIRSGLSYSGCRTIPEFKQRAVWKHISPSAAVESQVIGRGRTL